jgi:multiple sugar transport system ATP-binding protein
MASIEVDRISLRTGRVSRLEDVSFAIPDGGFVGVVGGSGSGKSTLLRTVAGLERPTSGVIRLGGQDVTRAAPGERDVAMVFQEPALLGHLSVRRNVSFPLDVRRRDAQDIRRRVDAEVRALRIEELLVRNPNELSHGEQQMVQIARALVRVPQVLLLDEPFAALDEPLRHRMRAEIAMLQQGYGVTTLMSTNDPLDVTTLTSTLIVLDEGRLVQYGDTSWIRRSPSTLLAAAATGSVSFIDMTVVADGEGFWLTREDPAGGEPVRLRAWAPALSAHVGSRVVVAIRPEHLVVSDTGSIPSVVERRIPIATGGLLCVVAGTPMTATTGDAVAGRGDPVRLRVDHLVVFDKLTGVAIA